MPDVSLPAVALEDAFQADERLLWALAYRVTGCAADADDVVQQTFVRALESPPPDTDRPWRPWLVRVALHQALDVLRRRRRRVYPGTWLPSPVEDGEGDPVALVPGDESESPERRYELRESASFAFLLALEALGPRPRAALLLRDVFGHSARETAELLDTSEANVRVLHHRGRRALRDYDRARCANDASAPARHRRALEAFLAALLRGDAAALEALLVEDVRTLTDAGGEFTALHGPLVGRQAVLQLSLRVGRRRGEGARIRPCSANGLPAVLVEFARRERRQAPRVLLRCELDREGGIREVHAVLASRKLTAVRFGSA